MHYAHSLQICAVVNLICISILNNTYWYGGNGFVYFTAVFALVFSIVVMVLMVTDIVSIEGLNRIPWSALVRIRYNYVL